MEDSNHRHRHYKCRALPTELIGHNFIYGWSTGIRTPTERIKIFSATVTLWTNVVSVVGFEPTTSASQRRRPTGLGYTEEFVNQRPLLASLLLFPPSLLFFFVSFVLFKFIFHFWINYFSNNKPTSLITP